MTRLDIQRKGGPVSPASTRHRRREAIVIGIRLARRSRQWGRLPRSVGGGDRMEVLVWGPRDVLKGDSAFDFFAGEDGLVIPVYEDSNVARSV
jgi:hypothetical protein